MNYTAMYRDKLVSAEEAVLSIHSGQTVGTGQFGSTPAAIFEKMPLLQGKATGIRTYLPITTRDFPFMYDPAYKDTFDHTATFLMAGTRKGFQSGMVQYHPSDLHNGAARWIEANGDDVFITAVAPMDAHGYFCMPLCLIHERAFLNRAKRVIVEVNPRLPRVLGDTLIHIRDVDMIVESERDLEILPESEITARDEAIGQYVASLVHDGDTIQLGWGGIPDAVARCLQGRHDLGIHSEMLCNGMVDLIESGVVTGRKKTWLPGLVVGAFAAGSQRLYDLLDENPGVRLLQGGLVNDPRIISSNEHFVSINSALSVDLTGQICAESLGSMQYSGSGGQFDMAYGAIHSPGGCNIIALPSTQKGGTVSTITAQLAAGSVVTTTRNIIDYVVTEYGVAQLRGRSVRQRAENLTAIAHPDFRAELRRQAQALAFL